MASPSSTRADMSLTITRSVGKEYTQEQFNEGMRCFDVYAKWWLDTVLEVGKKDTLVVMQSEDVKPNYRDDAPPYVHSFSWI
jgi:hypothetical protein